MGLRSMLIFTLILLVFIAFISPSRGEILEYTIKGTINEGTYIAVSEVIDRAEKERYSAVLFVVDTPGGLVTSTEKIISKIFNSKVPVLAYVPPGAFSASAGSLIVISANIAGMANGTSIGAATPITTGLGEPRVEQKVVNYLASYAKSIAEKRGRNATAIERFVTHAYSASARDAYRYGIIDILADSKSQFLEKADGMTVETSQGKVTVKTKNEKIVVYGEPIKVKIYNVISSPELASVLLIIGIYGLIYGLTSPGMGAEVLGAISLILALFGLGVINVNYMGVVLILLGILFLIAELLTPTYGVLGAASVISIVLGTLMLYREPLMPRDFYSSFTMLVGGLGLGIGAIMTFIIIKVIQIKKAKKKVGAEALIGRKGKVISFSNGEGMAKFDGELWEIVSSDNLKEGDVVIITGREGLTLEVRKYEG